MLWLCPNLTFGPHRVFSVELWNHDRLSNLRPTAEAPNDTCQWGNTWWWPTPGPCCLPAVPEEAPHPGEGGGGGQAGHQTLLPAQRHHQGRVQGHPAESRAQGARARNLGGGGAPSGPRRSGEVLHAAKSHRLRVCSFRSATVALEKSTRSKSATWSSCTSRGTSTSGNTDAGSMRRTRTTRTCCTPPRRGALEEDHDGGDDDGGVIWGLLVVSYIWFLIHFKMFVCACVCTYTHTHVNTHIYTYTYLHTFVHIHTHVHTCTQRHVCVRVYTDVYIGGVAVPLFYCRSIVIFQTRLLIPYWIKLIKWYFTQNFTP